MVSDQPDREGEAGSRDPVVAMLEARVERLEGTVRDLDGTPETAEYAVAVAQLRAARRALADYGE